MPPIIDPPAAAPHADATLRLIASRRFGPLLLTQMMTSFIDNLMKSAAGVLMLIKMPEVGASLLALGGGIIMAPYIVFSSLAGDVADRYEKAWLLRVTQLTALALAICSALALMAFTVTALFICLFGLGLQATFFGPLKYGVIPELVHDRELVAGNGLIEGGTFIGIVSGTTVGSALVMTGRGQFLVGLLAVGVALCGVASAFAVPRGTAAAPGLRIRANIAAGTVALVRQSFRVRPIRLSIEWLTWFWALGLIVLSEVPVVARDVLGGDENAISLMLGVFSVGVGAGSVMCGRLLHGDVSARHVPWAGFGLSLFTAAFAAASSSLGATGAPHSAHDLLTTAGGWQVLTFLLLLALAGGVFSVPLNAILQAKSDADARSRMVASNNIVNAVGMVAAAVAIAALERAGVSATRILWGTAAINLAVTLTTLRFAWAKT